jgi:hypothetical protein
VGGCCGSHANTMAPGRPGRAFAGRSPGASGMDRRGARSDGAACDIKAVDGRPVTPRRPLPDGWSAKGLGNGFAEAETPRRFWDRGGPKSLKSCEDIGGRRTTTGTAGGCARATTGHAAALPRRRVGEDVATLTPQSGGIEAQTGLRMMPTSPRSPLSFRTAGFPQYGWKVVQLKPAPGMRCLTTGLSSPFVHLLVTTMVRAESGLRTRSCTAWRVGSPPPQGPSLGSGL